MEDLKAFILPSVNDGKIKRLRTVVCQDEIRMALHYIFIKEGRMHATDGHRLLSYDISEMPGAEEMPEGSYAHIKLSDGRRGLALVPEAPQPPDVTKVIINEFKSTWDLSRPTGPESGLRRHELLYEIAAKGPMIQPKLIMDVMPNYTVVEASGSEKLSIVRFRFPEHSMTLFVMPFRPGASD